MKKLSEIEMDEYICAGDIETGVMTKEAYLESDYFLDWDGDKIYEAIPEVITKFDINSVIMDLAENNYEDWDEHVICDIDGNPEIRAVEKLINEIFEAHPNYYRGPEILNDMLPAVE